jgi:hypothetical protein
VINDQSDVSDAPFRGVAQVETATRESDRLALYIDRAALPGDRAALRDSAELLLAPPDILAELDGLPPEVTFRDVPEIWAALGHDD